MNDLKKFEHGEEGTHFACKEQVDKLGSKTPCCECSGHKCSQTKLDTKQKIQNILNGADIPFTKDYEFLVDQLYSLYQEEAENICKLIDEIELSYKDTSMEEWKAFKHIRNAIRDKYELLSTLKKGEE